MGYALILAHSSDHPPGSQPSLCCGRWVQQDLWLDTRVQIRSSRLELGRVENGRLKLRLTAPPADGKANQQARKLLAKSFGVGISQVKLINGQAHKNKLFFIRGPSRLPVEVIKI